MTECCFANKNHNLWISLYGCNHSHLFSSASTFVTSFQLHSFWNINPIIRIGHTNKKEQKRSEMFHWLRIKNIFHLFTTGGALQQWYNIYLEWREMSWFFTFSNITFSLINLAIKRVHRICNQLIYWTSTGESYLCYSFSHIWYAGYQWDTEANYGKIACSVT